MRFSLRMLWLLCLAGWACAVQAGDVAFWTPYTADPDTYALFPFDRADLADAEGSAKIAQSEALGDAAFAAAGKFGGALRVRGKGALRATPTAIFPGGCIAVEAWLKLEQYPQKEAYVLDRPAVVDRNPQYDPEVDLTKGFALLVDAKGAFHLETTNCFYGRTTRTSSPPGLVPLGQWVHLAGVSDGYPITFRRLYLNGREVQALPVAWGEAIAMGVDEEKRPGPIYLGNNEKLTAGVNGWLDQVRVHRKIAKFWQPDVAWPTAQADRPVVAGPPHFLADHLPIVHLPLDGDVQPAVCRVPDLKVQAAEPPASRPGQFVSGVRGKAWQGPLTLSAPRLLNLHEGTVEFWLQPVGVNNYADNNCTFFHGPFTLYFLNDGGQIGRKPFTLYFPIQGGIHFVHDGLGTEFHPGRWYHLAAAWKGSTIALYIDGRQAGKTFDRALATPENKALCTSIRLNSSKSYSVIDEVRLYDKALLPEEVANAYYRYREPDKLTQVARAKPLELKAQVLPSRNTIYYQCEAAGAKLAGARLRLTLRDATGKELLREEVPWSEQEQSLPIPALNDGLFVLACDILRSDGSLEPGDTFRFLRKHFAWEQNRLGLSDEIFPPFEPVQVQGSRVQVVGRTHTMNGFGLWDQVVTQGRELLAAPIGLRFTTAGGEGKWASSAGRWVQQAPKSAVYAAEAAADAVRVATASTIEIDGCMKVQMKLLPGAQPVEIQKLWIDIPLRAAETPLMHTIGDGLRANYAGRTRPGTGVVWDGAQVARQGRWRNCFVPYVWLGAEERGLCWFGENDKGWITEKHQSKTPTHELIRAGERLTLRVYLINTPAVIRAPRSLIFGLQASPTKPLPPDWRRQLPDMPVGLAVVPFGGLQCASQGPLRDDWSVVDQILACRAGQPLDQKWLARYTQEHRPPLVHKTWDWATSVQHFATRARDIGPRRPLTVYQEEMYAATVRPEWAVFQDEWNAGPYAYARVWLDPAVMQEGYSTFGGTSAVTFGPSYQDFGCYFADQWLSRGVSLYWDNTYPHLATNFRTSDAYRTEDGEIQPCLILWNQREYQQRVWHLLQQWRRRRPEPLHWVLHMTNTLVLPVHTWGTVDLDHELHRSEPFAPDWLRTETTGRQIGNLPLSLYAVSGSQNRVFARLAESLPRKQVEDLRQRAEWGMRAAHEIQHNGPLDKFLTEFGYGTERVEVHNYWAETPVLRLQPEQVKWLVLADRRSGSALVVLASWSAEQLQADFTVDEAVLGFPPRGPIADAETGATIAAPGAEKTQIKLPGPYGVRILRLSAAAR